MRQTKTQEMVDENIYLCLNLDCDGKVVYDESRMLMSDPPKFQGECENCHSLRYVHDTTYHSQKERDD